MTAPALSGKGAPVREAQVQYDVLKAWGAHPRVRLARVNTGVGWFNDAGPCRRKDPGARPVRFNPKGTADAVGIIAPQGRLMMIEFKSSTGSQRPEQVTMQRVVEAMGGVYILARSLADVDARMAKEGLTR